MQHCVHRRSWCDIGVFAFNLTQVVALVRSLIENHCWTQVLLISTDPFRLHPPPRKSKMRIQRLIHEGPPIHADGALRYKMIICEAIRDASWFRKRIRWPKTKQWGSKSYQRYRFFSPSLSPSQHSCCNSSSLAKITTLLPRSLVQNHIVKNPAINESTNSTIRVVIHLTSHVGHFVSLLA